MSTDKLKSLVGQRVKTLRERKGWTQTELGKRVGLGQVSIVHIEQGSRLPRLDKLIDIARATESTLHYICGIDERGAVPVGLEQRLLSIAGKLTDDQLTSLLAAAEALVVKDNLS